MKRTLRNPVNSFALVAALALVAGCAVVKRPPLDLATLRADGEAAGAAHRESVAAVVEKLAQRAIRRGDGRLDVLLLSGGGQNGAYGAGFLRGWRERPTDPMPSFDLVTGISAGALQAPFAFLGTEEATETIGRLFRDEEKRLKPKADPFFWLRKTGGVVKPEGFYETVRDAYDQRLAGALAPGFAEGRQLFVGTTDADLGIGRMWDLQREIERSDGVERVQRLLLASTAVPGYFPPVLLDGHLHFDGGVTGNFLTLLDLEQYRALAARLRELGSGPVTVRVWAILNVFPHAEIKVMPPEKATAIAFRATYLLYWAQQPRILRGLAERAAAVNAELDGLEVELRFTGVPDELSSDPKADKLFDPEGTRRLETLGYERAAGAAPWDTIPSGFTR